MDAAPDYLRRLDLVEAIERFDRDSLKETLEAAGEQRRRILELFPVEVWPTLPLERYALGGAEDTYCRLLEFGSPSFGGIGGGSAMKHMIFKRQNGPGWYFPPEYENEHEAWEAVRAGYVKLFAAADRDEFEQIDDIAELSKGKVLRSKTAVVYHPDRLLPIHSETHLDYWGEVFGVDIAGLGPLAKNRALTDALLARTEFGGWSPLEVSRFIYSWSPPDTRRNTLKISPGANAELWDECRRGGYIAVGADDIGNLQDFPDKDSFRQRYAELYGSSGPVDGVRRANDLWKLTQLSEGDVILAGRGADEVLGIGRVTSQGYEWRPDRETHRHTVSVRWDHTDPLVMDQPIRAWAAGSIVDVKPADYHAILLGAHGGGDEESVGYSPPDPVHLEAQRLLDRSRQLIFYGPPGTGKTYRARRHAVWLLDGGPDEPLANRVWADHGYFLDRERELSSSPTADRTPTRTAPRLTKVTFHPTYGYEDFVEGFRPVVEGEGDGLRLSLEPGVFTQVCRAAAADPGRPYVLLVDEINRGNMPKIFGELITLIEADKRGMTVTLPQSRELFSVPRNVLIIGTMNTADRSIHLMDAALRRRFAFRELLPDPGLLDGTQVGGVDLGELLEALNARIAAEFGREKQVGHSVLMNGHDPIKSAQALADAIRFELMPLLQEYCYGDYRHLANLVGDVIVDTERLVPNDEVIDDPDELVVALKTHLGL
ncbi:MAG: AAA family ATPase [Actinomycetota bacterium]|nr:AAA family ATPase [Actinomycetota bacterium]